jgi:hypothetical protein
MTTKILALTDALGNLVRFELLPGNRYDTIGVAPLIKGMYPRAVICSKAFQLPAHAIDVGASPAMLRYFMVFD